MRQAAPAGMIRLFSQPSGEAMFKSVTDKAFSDA
jgi:hypothetical protein